MEICPPYRKLRHTSSSGSHSQPQQYSAIVTCWRHSLLLSLAPSFFAYVHLCVHTYIHTYICSMYVHTVLQCRFRQQHNGCHPISNHRHARATKRHRGIRAQISPNTCSRNPLVTCTFILGNQCFAITLSLPATREHTYIYHVISLHV